MMSAAPAKESEACSAEWLSLSDDLLAGLVHALNNRVAALSVFSELIALGDSHLGSDGLLRTEVERLQRVTALLGMLPARNQAAEALEIDPVLDDAISLHAHHPRSRAIECIVERRGELPPVRATRWALLRLFLIIVHAAKGAAEATRRGRVTLYLTGGADSVTLSAFTRADGSACAVELATSCGGVAARVGDDLRLTLPSLQEVRRREKMARAGD